MVKYWNNHLEKYLPVSEIVCKIKVLNDTCGAGYKPNSSDDYWNDRGASFDTYLEDNTEFYFDNYDEFMNFKNAINHMADSLDELIKDKYNERVN